METIMRHVGEMKANERSAAELLLGHRLRDSERIIIQIMNLETAEETNDSPPTQSLPDWCNIYNGLTEEEIDNIDKSIVRCDLTRSFEQTDDNRTP